MVPLPTPFGGRPSDERPPAEVEDIDIDIDDDDAEVEGIDEDEDGAREVGEHDQDIWALRDVSLDVAPGTMLGIVGPNGSGKSTLLRVVTRLTPPTKGTVLLRGRAAPLVPSLPGVMLPGESLRRNVIQVASFYGIPKQVAVARTDAIAELAEIEELLDQRVNTLSRGLLQRFAFAIALQLEPDILVADDTIAVGDKHFQSRCIEHIRGRVEEGLTVLFATHQLDRVRDLCSEAVLMEAGRLVARGPTDEIVDRYEALRGAARAGGSSEAGAPPGHHGVIRSAGFFTMAGQPADSLHVSESGLLEIHVELSEAPVTFRCAVTLQGDEVSARAIQPATFTAEEPGLYVVSALMSPRTLGEGIHRAHVAVSEFTDDGTRSLGVVKDAFDLEIHGISDSGEGADLSHGEIGPVKRQIRLRWSVAPHSG
jgi:lipopolysaccharide transport system ATP-binding protein